MRQTDYLIVGQGIAGTALALTLLKKGKSVLIIDNAALSSCSKVAAGVFNPFNFRRLMNNWRAGELVNSAKQLYSETESFPGQILFPRRVMKILTSADEWRLWSNACMEKDGLFADPDRLENPFPGIVDAPFGIGIAHNAGNVDAGLFLRIAREKFILQDILLAESFDPAKLEITDSGINYDGKIAAGKIIFCEGHLVRKNPWFDFLPVYAVKGQGMQVRIPGLKLTDIISRNIYLLPVRDDLFSVGATYTNEEEDENITPEAEEELILKLKKIIISPFQIESRYAGMRPAVGDRRPILGRHPVYPQLCVFNGMGSKGVLLAPWLSEKLAEHLEEGKELPEEVRVERFARKVNR